MAVTFLKQGDDHAVAVLSQRIGKYETFNETRLTIETEHYLDDSSTKLHLMRLTEAQNTGFWLSSEEADNFVEAWTAYKANQQAKAEAEAQRQQEAIAEAYRLVAEEPSIKIEEKEARDNGRPIPAWYVFIPSTGWNTGPYAQWSYDADNLLESVKDAFVVLRGRNAVAS